MDEDEKQQALKVEQRAGPCAFWLLDLGSNQGPTD